MGLQEDFIKALHETEIHRQRQPRLLTIGSTDLPYVMLCESEVNMGDTVVRNGVVRVEKPQLMLLRDPVEFEGFEYNDNPNESSAFMALGRMASFPPGKYSNIETQLDVFEGSLTKAVDHHQRRLDADKNELTGVLSGPVDLWALSLFVYVGTMISNSAPNDISELIRRHMHPPGL